MGRRDDKVPRPLVTLMQDSIAQPEGGVNVEGLAEVQAGAAEGMAGAGTVPGPQTCTCDVEMNLDRAWGGRPW